LVCQNETATGVTSEVAAVRKAMDSRQAPGAAVRGLGERAGQHRFSHGRVGRRRLCQRLPEGSDAGPAGLGVTCVSQKALEAAKSANFRGAAISITVTW